MPKNLFNSSQLVADLVADISQDIQVMFNVKKAMQALYSK